MSYLDELLGEAEAYSNAAQRDQKRERSQAAVRYDSFDRYIYDELVEDVPAFSEMVNGLEYKWDYVAPLPQDVLQFFWQSDPMVKEPEDMDVHYLRNHAVCSDIADAPETPMTRSFTRHDRYAAAMATIAINDKVEELLDKYKDMESDLQAAAEAAAQAMADAESAQGGLEGALAVAGGLVDGFEGEGPMTEAQAAVAEAVAKALAEAQAAQQAATEAEQDARDEADKLAKAMNGELRREMGKISQDLDNQQEQFSAWGLNPGELSRMDWKERAELARRLDSNKLREMRDMVGSMRLASASAARRKTHWGRDELIGTTLGADPQEFISSEWATSRHPRLRLDFLQRVADASVLSRDYIGYEHVHKGGIVLLDDESGSMNGIRNIFAKGFGLGLLDAAKEAGRDFHAITFATARERLEYEFPKGLGPIQQVLDFAEHFFRGAGTDFMAPLTRALEVIEAQFTERGLSNADIIIVTDGEAGVTPEWLKNFQAKQKKLQFRVWGIMCGSHPSPTLNALCGNVRSVSEFVPGSIEDIFQAL